jgi:DNA-binding response OmpR family regulator
MKNPVLEDSPSVPEAVALILAGHPDQVLCARDIDGALSIIEAHRPDLLLPEAAIAGWRVS